MRTAITSRTAAVARRDLRSETQSWRKRFTKKHPPGWRRRRRRRRRRKNFLPPQPPIPSRRDIISRSGKPLTPTWLMPQVGFPTQLYALTHDDSRLFRRRGGGGQKNTNFFKKQKVTEIHVFSRQKAESLRIGLLRWGAPDSADRSVLARRY